MLTLMSLRPSLRPWAVHDDVIKWKHFSALLAICAGNSPYKGQWRGALMFSLICARINGWVNAREAGDLRRFCVHYNVIVMFMVYLFIALIFKSKEGALPVKKGISHVCIIWNIIQTQQLIWRSGTLRWNFCVREVQMNCDDFAQR